MVTKLPHIADVDVHELECLLCVHSIETEFANGFLQSVRFLSSVNDGDDDDCRGKDECDDAHDFHCEACCGSSDHTTQRHPVGKDAGHDGQETC